MLPRCLLTQPFGAALITVRRVGRSRAQKGLIPKNFRGGFTAVGTVVVVAP
jgi:hypothetical protein